METLSDNYIIRKACEKDIDSVVELYTSLMGTEGCTWGDDYPNRSDVHSDVSKDCLYVVCDMNQEIIGAAAVGKDDELDILDCWSPEIMNTSNLSRIGIRLSYQNKGIATYFLTFLEKECAKQGYDGMRFLVGKSNHKALALYNKFQYRNVGETFMFDIDWYCYEKKL